MRALAVTARGCCTLERPALNVFSVIWKTEPSLRDFSDSGDHTIGSFEDIPADCPVLFGFLGHPAIYTSGTPYWPRRTGVYGTGQLDAAGRILGRIYLVAKALSVKGLRFTRFAQASGIEYFKGRDRRMEVDIKAMGMPIVGVRCNRTVQLRIPSIRRRLSVYSKGHLIMAETMPE